MKVKLKRIIIFCIDVEKLVSFYQENFGLKLTGNPDKNWTVLKSGAIEIAFHKSGAKFLQADFQKFKGANSNIKLVLEIDSDLEYFRKKLISQKVKMKNIVSVKDLPYSWCDGIDPEGNVFQIMQILT